MLTHTNPSAPKELTKSRLTKDTHASTEISLLTTQNLRLSGEVAILRQNLVALEKENYRLKENSNTKILQSFKTSESLKKELLSLQSENRINENRLKAFKKPKSSTVNEIDYKWILKQIDTEIKFQLWPFETKRLLILSTYFYDDFERLLEDHSIENEIRKMRGNYTELCTLFMIFSSKKEIFDSLLSFIVELYFEQKNIKFANQVYRILCYCDLGWLLNFVENDAFMKMLVEFLDETVEVEMAIVFYNRVLKERPFILGLFLDKNRFQGILSNPFIDVFLDRLSKEQFKNYLCTANIKLIKKEYLKKIFCDEYFEIY